MTSEDTAIADIGEAGNYAVWVEDNFHRMDEGERYLLGHFHSLEAAIAACRKIVSDFLLSTYKPGMSSEELLRLFAAFGDSPSIVGHSPGAFSASSCAQELAAKITAEAAVITRASLGTHVDPGHGGLCTEFRIDPEADGWRVSARVSRDLPSPGERVAVPAEWQEILAKPAPQIQIFLDTLLGKHQVFALHEFATDQALLHPSFHTFRFEDDTGRRHEFRYVIESGKHLDPRYADLVREFDTFFDKSGLIERFRAPAQRRTMNPARAWWKFW